MFWKLNYFRLTLDIRFIQFSCPSHLTHVGKQSHAFILSRVELLWFFMVKKDHGQPIKNHGAI